MSNGDEWVGGVGDPALVGLGTCETTVEHVGGPGRSAVDALVSRPGVDAGPCRTRTLPLVGATEAASDWLDTRYGAEAPRLRELMAAKPELAEPVVPGLPYTRAELVWGVEHEGALTAGDLLDRRTRIGFVPVDRELAAPVAERHAQLLA